LFEKVSDFGVGLICGVGVSFAKACIEGVDENDLASFGVAKLHEAHGGQFKLSGIADAKCDKIMAIIESGKGAADAGTGEKIAEEKDNAFAFEDFHNMLYGGGYTGTAVHGLMEENFANDAKDVILSLFRRDKFFDAICENQ
jgi:hypothetical protein